MKFSRILFTFCMLMLAGLVNATELDTAVVWVGPSKHTWTQGQVRAIHQSPTAPTFQFHSSEQPLCIRNSVTGRCRTNAGGAPLGPWTLFFVAGDIEYTYEDCRALNPDQLFDFLIDFGFDVEFHCP